MTVESATFVASLSAANPAGTDGKNEGDDHLRLIKSVLQGTFPTASRPFYFPTYSAKTNNFTILNTEQNTHFTVDASAAARTATLPNPGASLAGWECYIQKIDSTSNAVVLSPSSGTINGATSLSLTTQWDSVRIRWSGTAWYASIISGSIVVSSVALTAVQINGAAELTDIALADYVPIFDASAALNKKITPLNFLDVVNLLTEKATPSSSADFVLLWDAAATEAKKARVGNLLSVTVPNAATQAEQETGSLTTVYVTPGRQQYHASAAKAWAKVVVSGGVPSLAAGYGVASVTDTAVGRLTITWSVPFSSINYAVSVSVERATTTLTANDRFACSIRAGSQAAGSVQFECWDEDGDLSDPGAWHIMAFGDV